MLTSSLVGLVPHTRSLALYASAADNKRRQALCIQVVRHRHR